MNVREKAVVLLSENEKERSFINEKLNEALKADFSKLDKSLLTILVNGTLQKKIQIDFYLKSYIKKDYNKLNIKIKNILRVAVYQILFMDKIPQSAACNEAVKITKKLKGNFMSSFVNGVLRSISREKEELLLKPLPDEIAHLVPSIIYNIWCESYGKVVADIIAENTQIIPKTTIVLNTAIYSKQKIILQLEKEDIVLKNDSIITSPCDIANLESFKKGMFLVQGLSSGVASRIINPKENEDILDLCAAPGGKSMAMQILAKNKANITSCDVNDSKIKRIDEQSTRLNLNIKTKMNDGTILNDSFIEKFDKVLCDVPCSGLGVIRKKRDIINKETTDFTELIQIQRKILKNATKYVKKGGFLYYSTCTLNSKENEENIANFLENHDNFKLIPIKSDFLNAIACKIYDNYVTILPSEDYDGFFIAKLRKEK